MFIVIMTTILFFAPSKRLQYDDILPCDSTHDYVHDKHIKFPNIYRRIVSDQPKRISHFIDLGHNVLAFREFIYTNHIFQNSS